MGSLVLLGLRIKVVHRLVEDVVRDDDGHREDVEGLGRTVGVLSDSLVVGAERVDDAASAVVDLVGRQLRLLGRDDSLARLVHCQQDGLLMHPHSHHICILHLA